MSPKGVLPICVGVTAKGSPCSHHAVGGQETCAWHHPWRKPATDDPSAELPLTVVCPTCRRDLPRSQFWKNAGRPNGLDSRCTDCSKEAARRYRASDTAISIAATDRGRLNSRAESRAMRALCRRFPAEYRALLNEARVALDLRPIIGHRS